MKDAKAQDFQEPDFKGIAQELMSRGVTYQDIQQKGTSYLKNLSNATLQDPKGQRPSDTLVPNLSQEEIANAPTAESVKMLLAEFEKLEMENVPQESIVQGGVTDLIDRPKFEGNDLLQQIRTTLENGRDIKEQVFMSHYLTNTPFSPESVESETQKDIQGGESIRNVVDSDLRDYLRITKEERLIQSLKDNVAENAHRVKNFIEIEKIQPETKKVQMYKDFYDSLPQEKVVPEDAFSFVTSQVNNLNALSVAAQAKLTPEKTLEDLAEIFVPVYGSAIYVEFQNSLAEGAYEKAMQLLVGSSQIDKVAETYWSKSQDEQAEYLLNIVTALESSLTSAGTNNDILKLDFVAKITEKLLEGPSTVGKFTTNDAINFTENLLAEISVVAPVVKVIKDTIMMRRVAKMGGFTARNSVEALDDKRPPVKEGEFVPDGDPIYPNSGSGTSLDMVIAKSPKEFKKLTNNRELKDVTDAMAVEPADMPRRILPRMADNADDLPQPDGVHHTYLSDTLQRQINNNHLAQQLQKEEIDGLLPEYVLKVAEDLGETATPHLDKSYFRVNEEAAGSSLGTFVVRLGKSPDSGFTSVEDAQKAASKLYGESSRIIRKTPYGNFSKDLRQGENVGDSYFIEIQQTQQTTALSGNGMFLGGDLPVTGNMFKPLLNLVLDDGLLFHDKIQRTYSNTRDRANAFGMELEERSRNLLELSAHPRDLDDFNMVSIKMQDQGIDVIDPIQITQLLGKTPSDRVIKALESARELNSANWELTNQLEYNALVGERFKTTLIGNERFIGKPVRGSKSQITSGGNTVDVYNETPSIKSLSGKKVYDPESKTDLPLTQDIIDGLYDGGGVIVKLYKPTKVDGLGEFTQIVVRNPARDIKPLQRDVTPYIKGHYPQAYEADGWIVVGNVTKTIDGVKKTVPQAMGIAKNKVEANKLASALANRGARLVKKPVVPTAEYARRVGVKTSSAISLEMSMERGQRLKGFHGEEFGEAELVDPFSAYVKTLYKTRQKYEQPVQDIMKKRFLDMYGDLLIDKRFPSDVSYLNRGSIFKDPIGDIVQVERAIAFHRRIRLAEGGDLENAANFVNNIIRRLEMVMDETGNQNMAAALKALDINKAQALTTGLANVRFIWGNPLFQILGPVAQSPFFLSQGPVLVAKALGELTHSFVPLVMSRGTENLETWAKWIAKERGVTPERIKHELETIIESGIVRTVGAGQDYQTDMSLLLQTLMENKVTRGATVLTGKAFKLPVKLMKGGVLGAMDMYELLGFFIARNRFVKENPTADWTSPKSMEEITFYARNLTFNQNDTSRLAFQNADNPLKFSMAMMSYVNRLFIRQYLDPLTLGLVSHLAKPKGSRNTSVYANTPAKALGTAFIGLGLFGESYLDPLDGDYSESQVEYLQAIADGRFDKVLDSNAKAFFKNMGIDQPTNFLAESYYMGLMTSTTNAMFAGDVDFNEKFINNSYIKAMHDKFLNLRTGNALDAVFGLPYAAAAGLVNTTKHNTKMLLAAREAGGIESSDVAFAAIEFLSQLKIVDDAVAGYYAINLERRISKSTLSPRDKTTLYEQVSRIMGGVPYSEGYSMRGMDFADLPRISSDHYQNYMIRKTQMDVYNAHLKKGATLTEEEMSDIVVRGFTMAVKGEEDLLTEDLKSEFRKKIMNVGAPVVIGGFTIDRDVQEKSIAQMEASLQDETPEERKEKIQERLGLIKLQIQANPREAALVAEKEILETMLSEFYGKTGEELNREFLEEVTR